MPNLLNPSRFGSTAVGPASISGLLAWYSADAQTGLSDNTTLSTWNDQSGLGNHGVATGTPKWRSTAGSAGGPAVQFAANGYYSLPTNLFSGLTEAEIFCTIKGGASISSHWGMGQATGTNDEGHYPFNFPAGDIYEAFGMPTGLRQTFSDASQAQTWHRYNVRTKSADFACLRDEVSQVTYTTAYTPTFRSVPILGAGVKSSAVDIQFTGWFGGVAIYNRKLTTPERATLATWFTTNPSGGTP